VVPSALSSLDSALDSVFPPDLRGVPGSTVPRSLAYPGSSSQQLRLLSRVRHRSSPVRRGYHRTASLSLFLLRDISTWGPLIDGILTSVCCSALGVLHTLDGLLPLVPCEPISSRCRVRDFTSGVFPGGHRVGSSPALAFLPFPDACLRRRISAPAHIGSAPRP